MSYETAIARMYALGHELAQTPSQKFDLAHTRVLLAALGHPEQRVRGVLIADRAKAQRSVKRDRRNARIDEYLSGKTQPPPTTVDEAKERNPPSR